MGQREFETHISGLCGRALAKQLAVSIVNVEIVGISHIVDNCCKHADRLLEILCGGNLHFNIHFAAGWLIVNAGDFEHWHTQLAINEVLEVQISRQRMSHSDTVCSHNRFLRIALRWHWILDIVAGCETYSQCQ